MRPFFRGLWLSLVVTVSMSDLATAQYAPKRTEEIARSYNQGVKPINDRIDELRRKSNDSSLTMNEAARLVDQQSALRRQADQLWSATQGDVTGVYRRTGDAINRYNAETRRLDFESSIVGSQIDLLNNVGKYPTRGQFDQNKDALSQQWEQTYGSRLRPFGDEFAQRKTELFGQVKDRYGIDLEQTGYSRIGTINPYTGEAYYKYYGPDGNLVAGQWKDDANGWNKWREDVNTSWRRQRDQQQQLQRDSIDLTRFNNQMERSWQGTKSGIAAVGELVRKIDFAGRWNGNDNVGNWVRLSLYGDGSMSYAYGKTGTSYSSGGTWRQSGREITMRTNDGEWSFESRITEQFRLQFTETNANGKRFTNYLSR